MGLLLPFYIQHRELSGVLVIWDSRLQILEACHSAYSRDQLFHIPSAISCHTLSGWATCALGQGQWFSAVLSMRTPFYISIFMATSSLPHDSSSTVFYFVFLITDIFENNINLWNKLFCKYLFIYTGFLYMKTIQTWIVFTHVPNIYWVSKSKAFIRTIIMA